MTSPITPEGLQVRFTKNRERADATAMQEEIHTYLWDNHPEHNAANEWLLPAEAERKLEKWATRRRLLRPRSMAIVLLTLWLAAGILTSLWISNWASLPARSTALVVAAIGAGILAIGGGFAALGAASDFKRPTRDRLSTIGHAGISVGGVLACVAAAWLAATGS